MICLQLFLQGHVTSDEKNVKRHLASRCFLFSFVNTSAIQVVYTANWVYHLPPIFREPETAIDFRIFSELLFFWTTNPRPFGRFWISAGSAKHLMPGSWRGRVGEGFRWNAGEKTHQRLEGWRMKFAGKLRLFHQNAIKSCGGWIPRSWGMQFIVWCWSQHKKWTVFKKQMPQVRMAIATRMTSQ